MSAIIILTISSLLILFFGFSKQRGVILPLSFIALIASFAMIAMDNNFWSEYLTNMISIQSSSKSFALLICAIAICIFPFFHELLQRGNEELADFIGIILLSYSRCDNYGQLSEYDDIVFRNRNSIHCNVCS
jgi:NADH:ubiquinone oxidoreductase subunit 2 (subunit N)